MVFNGYCTSKRSQVKDKVAKPLKLLGADCRIRCGTSGSRVQAGCCCSNGGQLLGLRSRTLAGAAGSLVRYSAQRK